MFCHASGGQQNSRWECLRDKGRRDFCKTNQCDATRGVSLSENTVYKLQSRRYNVNQFCLEVVAQWFSETIVPITQTPSPHRGHHSKINVIKETSVTSRHKYLLLPTRSKPKKFCSSLHYWRASVPHWAIGPSNYKPRSWPEHCNHSTLLNRSENNSTTCTLPLPSPTHSWSSSYEARASRLPRVKWGT